MRLGGHVFPNTKDPEELVSLLAEKGYRAGYCPMGVTSQDTDQLKRIREAFAAKDIVIAEVGAWSNPRCGTEEEKKKSVDYIIDRLAVAEELGARCCVNVIGTLGPGDSSVPGNYSQEFFDETVDLARYIVGQVNPLRTKLAFEITPFTFLDGADGYEKLLKAIDRPGVAVHLDPINCIFTPRNYHECAEVFRYTVKKLAPFGICSVHLKDLYLQPALANVRIDEVIIGTGGMDYRALLTELNTLPADTPVMLEHLENDEQYDQAAASVRKTAAELGIMV